MKLFSCSNCGNTVYFENRACEACGRLLGYRASSDAMVAIPPGGPATDGLRFCFNAGDDACNWLVEAHEPGGFCRACRHNGVIPDLAAPGNLLSWRLVEEAKRRMFYSLLRWGLPAPTRAEDASDGLRFEFLADGEDSASKVLTGHADGVITIALAEADDVERERRRAAMGEPYRTLIGHFRHEIGHYYWNLLVRDGGKLDACRAVFGDDRADYGEALRRHHAGGPPEDWRDDYVSSYATMHPWEDFAETWAHAMHIVDTLETAAAFGISVRPRVAGGATLSADIDFDPYRARSFDEIMSAWLPVVLAMNALNRSMGLPDLYPFVVTPPVRAKLAFVHELMRAPGAPVDVPRRVNDEASGEEALGQHPVHALGHVHGLRHAEIDADRA